MGTLLLVPHNSKHGRAALWAFPFKGFALHAAFSFHSNFFGIRDLPLCLTFNTISFCHGLHLCILKERKEPPHAL